MYTYISVDLGGHPQGTVRSVEEKIDTRLIAVVDETEADGMMWDFTNLIWIPTDIVPEVIIKKLNGNGFRERFGYTKLMQLDLLEAQLEDDVWWENNCPNSDGTAITRNAMRNPIRTGFKDMQYMIVFDVTNPMLVRFVDAMLTAGFIDQTQHDTFLDTTDLEQ